MSRPVIVGLALREDDAAPIRLALTLAGLSGAPIALVHALPREAPGRLPVPEYTAAIREAAQEKLRAAIAGLPEGTAVSSCLVDGSPSRGLQQAAEELGAVAVVVGSTHHGAIGRVLAGDVAAGLMHDTPARSPSRRAAMTARTARCVSASPTTARPRATPRSPPPSASRSTRAVACTPSRCWSRRTGRRSTRRRAGCLPRPTNAGARRPPRPWRTTRSSPCPAGSRASPSC